METYKIINSTNRPIKIVVYNAAYNGNIESEHDLEVGGEIDLFRLHLSPMGVRTYEMWYTDQEEQPGFKMNVYRLTLRGVTPFRNYGGVNEARVEHSSILKNTFQLRNSMNSDNIPHIVVGEIDPSGEPDSN